MSKERIIATLLVLASLAVAALAHDTWLIPDRFVVEPDASVVLDLTSGMAFPAVETSIKPERLQLALFRLAGQKSNLSEFSPMTKSLRFKTRFVGTGVATLWVDLKPRSLELTATQVTEYLNEIDASKTI